MKTNLSIYSPENLKIFFSNLEYFFEIQIKNLEEVDKIDNEKNLSVLFLNNKDAISETIIKQIAKNENFVFVCKDFNIFQKFELSEKNSLISPVSIYRFIDVVNNLINTKKHILENIELYNNTIKNTKTNQIIYLTQAENYILLKLFKEENVKKKLLEREALDIKQELNTSSMESHLNRIRKKLKKISSDLTISSKDKYVRLEIINPDK